MACVTETVDCTRAPSGSVKVKPGMPVSRTWLRSTNWLIFGVWNSGYRRTGKSAVAWTGRGPLYTGRTEATYDGKRNAAMTDQDQPPAPERTPTAALWLSPVGWVTDTGLMLRLLTRLPAPAAGPVVFGGRLARALRTIPLVGAIVGAIGGLAYIAALWLGLAPLIAATLAVLATLVATGAYHEDGFADTCDGLGGAFERERKLAIMQDSRHGTFGVAAIVASLLLRVAALAAIAEPGLVFAALIAAHAAARAFLPVTMFYGNAAKSDGQGFAAGKPETASAWAALALAAIIALVALGLVALPALAAGAVAAFAMFAIARRQIGGYTGDVLGAIEQVAEIAMLLALAALA